MRTPALLFLFLCLCHIAPAQTPNGPSGSITGLVKDSLTGQPLQKASIIAIGASDPKNRILTLTDDQGRFTLQKLKFDTWSLSIEYIGYAQYQRNAIRLDKSTPTFRTPTILLTPSTSTLQTAVVTASRPLLENKIDRIVYNVDRDVTSQGGVATDVLRKIPQVSVDVNGNVELLGNPSILFLINGKKSTIFGNSIVDALQSIPAAQIQSIEVMSSPGAKYDATGTGGVINIILKKNKSEGFSGAVNATAGTRQENGSVNLSYKNNNVSLSGYFNGSDQLTVSTHSDSRRNSFDTASGSQYFLEQQGNSDFNRHAYRAGLSLDWDLGPKDNIGATIGYNQFGNSNAGLFNQYNTGADKNGTKLYDEYSLRTANTKLQNTSLDLSLDYTKKFHREKEQLNISLAYSTGQNNTSYNQYQQYLTTDSLFSGSTSTNPGRDKLSSFTIDYAWPLAKNFLLETGAKTEIESLISDANVYTFNPVPYNYFFDNQQSYTSTFRRQVYAGYVSATFSLFHYLNIIAGIRSEYTVNKAFYSNSGHVKIPDYNNLAPSFTIYHAFEDRSTIKFSYAYRLERPEYRDLNPFVNLADPQNITTGNPYIQPEIGHDFQLGYNYNLGKDNTLNIVLLYTHNSPDIKSYTTFYPSYKVGDSVYTNVNVTQRSNIASEDRWGANLGGSFAPLPKLAIRPSVQLYDRITNNIYSIPARISGFEYRWNINANYTFGNGPGHGFGNGLIAETFASYRSGIHWQGTTPSFLTYTLALRQPIFGGKGSLGLVAINAFGKNLTQQSIIQGTGFTTNNRLDIPYRSFGLNFLYKFGKIKISKPKEDENLLSRPPVEN
jgi:ferric enterobactin receptor